LLEWFPGKAFKRKILFASNADFFAKLERTEIYEVKLMSNFFDFIQVLSTSTSPPTKNQLEPRRVRRQKARDIAKTNKLTQKKAG
jgi:hypothetical protein